MSSRTMPHVHSCVLSTKQNIWLTYRHKFFFMKSYLFRKRSLCYYFQYWSMETYWNCDRKLSLGIFVWGFVITYKESTYKPNKQYDLSKGYQRTEKILGLRVNPFFFLSSTFVQSLNLTIAKRGSCIIVSKY